MKSFSTPVVAISFNLFNDIILNTGRWQKNGKKTANGRPSADSQTLFHLISSTKSFSKPVVAISFNLFNDINFNTGRCYFIQFLQRNHFQHRSLLFHSIYSTISISTPVVAISFNFFNDIIFNTGRCYFIQFIQRCHFQHRSLLFHSIYSTKSFSTPVVAISFNLFNDIIFNTGRCYFIQFHTRNARA